jgi:hypothetical protein
MTHRGPLVTLAGLVVAFGIFFGINLANSAPHQEVGEGYSSGSSSVAEASGPSTAGPSRTATEGATPGASATEPGADDRAGDEFPNKIVYAGRTEDGSAAIAVAVHGGQAAAYFCDGSSTESWLRGTASEGELNLQSKDGDSLEARLDGSKITGKIEVNDEKLDFTIGEAKPPAGLYRAEGSSTTIGWIILSDGTQVGIQTDDRGQSKAAPELNPNRTDVNADGEDLTAEPVEGNADI